MGMHNYLCVLVVFLFTEARAFSIPTVAHRSGIVTSRSILCSQSKSASESKSESSDGDVDDYDVTCFIVNEEEIIADGEKPHVVCTAEPEEYAWFNGIDPKMMLKTEDALEGAVECKEGESYKGKPEWECA